MLGDARTKPGFIVLALSMIALVEAAPLQRRAGDLADVSYGKQANLAKADIAPGSTKSKVDADVSLCAVDAITGLVNAGCPGGASKGSLGSGSADTTASNQALHADAGETDGDANIVAVKPLQGYKSSANAGSNGQSGNLAAVQIGQQGQQDHQPGSFPATSNSYLASQQHGNVPNESYPAYEASRDHRSGGGQHHHTSKGKHGGKKHGKKGKPSEQSAPREANRYQRAHPQDAGPSYRQHQAQGNANAGNGAGGDHSLVYVDVDPKASGLRPALQQAQVAGGTPRQTNAKPNGNTAGSKIVASDEHKAGSMAGNTVDCSSHGGLLGGGNVMNINSCNGGNGGNSLGGGNGDRKGGLTGLLRRQDDADVSDADSADGEHLHLHDKRDSSHRHKGKHQRKGGRKGGDDMEEDEAQSFSSSGRSVYAHRFLGAPLATYSALAKRDANGDDQSDELSEEDFGDGALRRRHHNRKSSHRHKGKYHRKGGKMNSGAISEAALSDEALQFGHGPGPLASTVEDWLRRQDVFDAEDPDEAASDADVDEEPQETGIHDDGSRAEVDREQAGRGARKLEARGFFWEHNGEHNYNGLPAGGKPEARRSVVLQERDHPHHPDHAAPSDTSDPPLLTPRFLKYESEKEGRPQAAKANKEVNSSEETADSDVKTSEQQAGKPSKRSHPDHPGRKHPGQATPSKTSDPPLLSPRFLKYESEKEGRPQAAKANKEVNSSEETVDSDAKTSEQQAGRTSKRSHAVHPHARPHARPHAHPVRKHPAQATPSSASALPVIGRSLKDKSHKAVRPQLKKANTVANSNEQSEDSKAKAGKQQGNQAVQNDEQDAKMTTAKDEKKAGKDARKSGATAKHAEKKSAKNGGKGARKAGKTVKANRKN